MTVLLCLQANYIFSGAPELHPGWGGRGSCNQKIDIWSLGCVFSVAATWVVFGYQGIKQYAVLRQDAIRRIMQDSPNDVRPVLERGDYFHDGHGVLSNVTNWHEFVRQCLRKTDVITPMVLDVVDKWMLVGAAGERIASSALCLELDRIKERALEPPLEARKILPTAFDTIFREDRLRPTTVPFTKPQTSARSHVVLNDRSEQPLDVTRQSHAPSTIQPDSSPHITPSLVLGPETSPSIGSGASQRLWISPSFRLASNSQRDRSAKGTNNIKYETVAEAFMALQYRKKRSSVPNIPRDLYLANFYPRSRQIVSSHKPMSCYSDSNISGISCRQFRDNGAVLGASSAGNWDSVCKSRWHQ